MADEKQVRLHLTQDQKAQVKTATGKDAEDLEFSATELEERIAPLKPWNPRGN